VILLTRLVLFGAAVVVDGEEHAVGFQRGRAKVNGRLPTVGPDLEQRPPVRDGQCRLVKRQPFNIGHESGHLPRQLSEPLVQRR
jgi:hypothetical protein